MPRFEGVVLHNNALPKFFFPHFPHDTWWVFANYKNWDFEKFLFKFLDQDLKDQTFFKLNIL
jgi:hypothetical protein